MGHMNDIDIILTEASDKGEAAGRALVDHIDQIDAWNALRGGDANLGRLVKALRAAAADAYDAAVDLPITLRENLGAAPEPAHTLDEVWADVQTLLERTTPTEVNYVMNMTQPVTGVDDLKEAAEAEPSRYGVRLTFADDTGADYDDVTGVQVYDKQTETFPFGFLELEVETTNPDGTKETTREHRPGFWKPEDGEFVPFSAVEAPNPNQGW